MTQQSETPERLPSWMGMEFGWDYLDQVNWALVRQNLASTDYVLSNPEKFPKADFDTLEELSINLHTFLAVHYNDTYRDA